MREVREASRERVATTSSSGEGAIRWSESQKESRPHSSARVATSKMVSGSGSPRRNRPNPTPILTCFMTFSPARFCGGTMIITMIMERSPSAPRHLDVTFLGTGDAFASRGRFQSGYLLEGDGHRVLMEAGPTVLCALKRANIDPASIDLLLISHLHGDHFAGLPFLILDYLWESHRRTTLTIAGPRHLEERTWRLFYTMFPRPSGAVEKVADKLKFVVLEPGCDVKFGKIRVSAIR